MDRHFRLFIGADRRLRSKQRHRVLHPARTSLHRDVAARCATVGREAAKKRAERMVDGHDVELWEHARRIAIFLCANPMIAFRPRRDAKAPTPELPGPLIPIGRGFFVEATPVPIFDQIGC
jgi:hypothetical protein